MVIADQGGDDADDDKRLTIEKHAEKAARKAFARLPRGTLAQGHEAHRIASRFQRDVTDRRQTLIDRIAGANPLQRILERAIGAQNRLFDELSGAALHRRLSGLSDASLAAVSGRLLEAQVARSLLAQSQPLTTLLGDTLADRIAATLPNASRILSRFAGHQVSLAAFVAADLARQLRSPDFGATFGGHLLRTLDEVSRAEDDAERDQKIDELRTMLDECRRELPRTSANLIGYASMLLLIILYLLASRSSREDADRIIEAIREAPRVEQQGGACPDLHALCERLLTEAGDDLLSNADEESGLLYIATTRVNVRLSPSIRSPRLVLLHPGQAVQRLEKRRKWVRVGFFDYVAGEQRTGWMFSKYLKPIKSTAQMPLSVDVQ